MFPPNLENLYWQKSTKLKNLLKDILDSIKYTQQYKDFAVKYVGVFMNNRLNSQKCGVAAVKANCIWGYNRKGVASSLGEVLFPLSLVPVKYLENCAQFWSPQYKKDLGILE